MSFVYSQVQPLTLSRYYSLSITVCSLILTLLCISHSQQIVEVLLANAPTSAAEALEDPNAQASADAAAAAVAVSERSEKSETEKERKRKHKEEKRKAKREREKAKKEELLAESTKDEVYALSLVLSIHC